MSTSTSSIHAKGTIRTAPWFLFGATILVLPTFYFGVPPLSWLLVSLGFGVLLFLLMVISWRRRSGGLRTFSFVFMLVSLQVFAHSLPRGAGFDTIQATLLIMVVYLALIVLLRPWIHRYAGLDACEPAKLPPSTAD